jgi:HSP20 family protein
MAGYKSVLDIILPTIHHSSNHLMRSSVPIRTRNHITRVFKTPSTRNMSLLFPRFAYGPAHCGTVRRHDFAPLFSLFDDSINELTHASRHARKQWTPRFDVKETKDTYTVDAEVPGVEQENISIEFTDEHTLTIKGRSERRVEKGKKPEVEAATPAAAIEDTPSEKSHQVTVEDEEPANASAAQEIAETAKTETKPAEPQEQYWYSERRVGEFTRSFSFPARVDQDAVKATLKNGVLSIVVPKAPVPESRRINIE